MTKALLSNINSIWGTIINPQSSNTYRHILSFENDDLKNKFIDQQLFNGEDHLQLLESQPKIAFTQISASLATFTINVLDYPNETINSLLNKDFAIIKEENSIRYYTLTSQRKGTQVVFNADLDIFFTHDIKTMFNDKDSQIQRGMIDRIKTENGITTFIPNIDSEKLVSQFYNPEPIDTLTDENLVPHKYETFKDDIEKYIEDKSMDDATKEIVINSVIESKWTILFRSIANGSGGGIKEMSYFNNAYINGQNAMYSLIKNKNSKYGSLLPYGILIAPQDINLDEDRNIGDHIEISWWFAKNVTDFTSGNNMVQLKSFSKPLIEEPDVIQNTHSIISTSVTSVLSSLDDDKIVIRYDSVNKRLNVIFKAYNQSYRDDEHSFPVTYSYKGTGGQQDESMFLVRVIDDDISKQDPSLPSSIKPFALFNNFKDQFDITKKIDKYNTEVKSWFAPYRKLKLRHSTKLEKILIAQQFDKNDITIKQQYSMIPELWNHITQVENYNNISFENKDQLPPELQEHFEDIAPYGLPTEQNAYETYIASHRSQMTSGIFQSIGNSALSLGGSVATGNVIGGIGSITSAIGSIANMYALQKDLQRTPLKVNQTSSTLIRDLSYKDFRTNITEYKLPEYMLIQIRKFFYQYGYNINHNLFNINDFINSRYYFNYLQAPETFENIKLQASGEIKQIINDTLANGVHIWHIRDLATFKGVKDYSYENVEITYLNALKQVKNAKG